MNKNNKLIEKILNFETSEQEILNLLNQKNISGNYFIPDKFINYILNSEEVTLDSSRRYLIENNLEHRKEYYYSLVSGFYNLLSPGDLAILIGFQYKNHIVYLIDILRNSSYSVFYIPKKNGGFRTISAPDPNLMLVQSRLNFILNLIYEPKPSAHGFVLNRSIVSNANSHIGKNNILNIDLKDFFPSINLGRTRGLFMSPPYNLKSNIATILANICCYNNQLPQGAPTSPVITNLICRKLDQKLIKLAKKYFCHYTRYADDITFSNTRKYFPENLLSEIKEIISEEGFQINEKKVRIQSKFVRQEVTGLTVNEKVNIRRDYIRNVRAILHCWKTKGINEAASIYNRKYSRYRLIGIPDFKNSLRGKIEYIGMVRGKNDELYNKYLNSFSDLQN